MNTVPPLIDVHHHFEPTAHNFDGRAWSVERALDEMDRSGVTTAIGYTGPIFERGAAAAKTSRSFNEWSADVCARHAGRFGSFASIPMDDVDRALGEIAYALDVLEADGIGLATHYAGAPLGAREFRPIFEELHRRKAVVFVHPQMDPCPQGPGPRYESDLIHEAWIEFPTNTARTILSLWASGTLRACSDVRFVFCHGGGVLPILLGRFAGFAAWRSFGPEKLRTIFPDGVYAEFAKLRFECAQAYAPETIELLRRVVPVSHLLFGTDCSYFPIAHAVEQFARLELSEADRRMIGYENAAALLTRRQAAKIAHAGPE